MSNRSQDFRVRNGWTVAHFPGVCADCGRRFAATALITYVSSRGGWRAACCATDKLRELVRQEETRGTRSGA